MAFETIIKWLGRTFGLILVIVSIIFLAGDESPLIESSGFLEVTSAVGIIIMCIGALTGFWKDIAGAGVIFLGYMIYAVTIGKIFPGPIFPQFLIVALIYIFNGWNLKR